MARRLVPDSPRTRLQYRPALSVVHWEDYRGKIIVSYHLRINEPK